MGAVGGRGPVPAVPWVGTCQASGWGDTWSLWLGGHMELVLLLPATTRSCGFGVIALL